MKSKLFDSRGYKKFADEEKVDNLLFEIRILSEAYISNKSLSKMLTNLALYYCVINDKITLDSKLKDLISQAAFLIKDYYNAYSSPTKCAQIATKTLFSENISDKFSFKYIQPYHGIPITLIQLYSASSFDLPEPTYEEHKWKKTKKKVLS